MARPLALTLAAVGVLGGVFWSLAYVNGVYNREHTWITASRWIYANAAPESKLLWELWDDPLPKAIPGEPGMDMGSRQLTNIDWSPYEEDTVDKYALMKEKLREADYVVYSSKRIYDSVDELPQRYPMTNLYYAAMRDGRLGFELAAEFTSPPRLFGLTFDDRNADESYSLYDHPQVSVYQKVRDLSDAEYDAIFDSVWAQAVPGYRGPDSPLSPFLNFIGLGNEPGSESVGLLNRIIGLFTAAPVATAPVTEPRQSLMFAEPITSLAIVDNYRWNTWASENTLLAMLWWWAVLSLFGWLVWPMGFLVFRPMRDRGFFLSRTLGWLLGGWVLWILINLGLLQNLVIHAWLSVLLLAVPGIVIALRLRTELMTYVRAQWRTMLAGEVVFGLAYLFFVGVRMLNPDLWQPWFGGEKQMEFAFVNGILRSPTFPPVDPHFSGGFINYYYFGLYLVAYLDQIDRYLCRGCVQFDHCDPLCPDGRQYLCCRLFCRQGTCAPVGEPTRTDLEDRPRQCVARAALCDDHRQPGWICSSCAQPGHGFTHTVSICIAGSEATDRRDGRLPEGGHRTGATASL